SAATERQKPARSASRTAQTSARQSLRECRRPDSLFRRNQRRRGIAPCRSNEARAGRINRKTAWVEIRARPTEWSLDQIESAPRAGIRDWRFYTPRGRAGKFLRDPYLLL